ncbi:LPS-assembly protein LptD [soil metagenome]
MLASAAAGLAPSLAAQGDVRSGTGMKLPPKGTRLNVVADRITYDARTKTAVAIGKVELQYGPYTLVATRVSYDQKRDIMTANGEVRLQEPGGNVLEAHKFQLQNRFRDGFAEYLRLLLTNDATITAQYAVRKDGYLTVYENATYTRCKTCTLDSGKPVWQVKARKVTHDEREATLHYEHATLELGGVDLFTLPSFSQPDPTVKKRSGFLAPQVSYGGTYGLGVEVPYFWNIAPDYDLTLRPRVMSDQGLLPRFEWRQRLTTGEYSIDAAGLYQLTEQDPPDSERWRGAARTQGSFQINRNWNWGWDGTLTSDDTFLDHYDIDERNQAMSDLYLVGLHDRNYFSAQALHFRPLNDEENNDEFPYVLPYVRNSYTFDRAVIGGEFGLDWSVYSLHRNDAYTPFQQVDLGTDQTRGIVDFHWQRQIINGFGQVITPFTRLRGDMYLTENVPDPDVPGLLQETETTARVLPMGGIDMRWPFISSTGDFQHVVTPVAQVIAATNETDEDRIGNEDAITVNFDTTSLFLTDRFTGLDRYEGGTRANAGVLYSILAPNGGYLRFALGESFHLAGENSFADGTGLEGNNSDLVTSIALQPWENLLFSYQMRFAENLTDINTQEGGVSLNFDRFGASLFYANLEADPFSGRPEKGQQLWGTASWYFSKGWRLFGGARYDLQNGELLRDTVGIGYDCDCMSFKLAYEEDRTDVDGESDRSLMFSVELKTLGGFSVAPKF